MNTKQKILALSVIMLAGCNEQAEQQKAVMQPQLQVPAQQASSQIQQAPIQQAPIAQQPQVQYQQPQVQYQQPQQPIIVQQPQADSHTDAAIAAVAGAAVGYALAQNNQPQRSYQDLHRYDRVIEPAPTTIVRERVIIKERTVPAPVTKPTPPIEASRQPQVVTQSAKIPATTVPQAQMQPNKWAGPSTYNSKQTVTTAPSSYTSKPTMSAPRASTFSSSKR